MVHRETALVRVAIDQDRCAGHGVCVATAPDVFSLDDDGSATAIDGDVPDESTGLIEESASQCPERAIIFTSD